MSSNQKVTGESEPFPVGGSQETVRPPNSFLAERYFARLGEAMRGLDTAEFARRAEVPYSAMRNYVTGRSLPGWENAVKIARAAGRSLDWFAGSEGDAQYAAEIDGALESIDFTTAIGRRMREETARQMLDFALLPLYDVRASAGHGAWNDEERVSKMLAFRRDWLHAELGTRINDLILLYADGDSMEPTIGSGDVVMVDRAQLDVRDGIYVWASDGALLIKRLQRLAAGRLQVLSDNPRFPAYEADQAAFAAPSTQIIGRVVWAGVKL